MHRPIAVHAIFQLTMQLKIILIRNETYSQLDIAPMFRFRAAAIVAAFFWAALPGYSTAQPRPSGMPDTGLPVTQADAHLGTASDDADFLFRLGMLEGHLMVGHELVQAHQEALALPHFGHPVRELYEDITGYLQQQGFPPFDKQLAALEAAVAAAPGAPDTEAQYQATIATLHKARDLAPAELRASLPDMIKVCADTIDAASGEYGEALERGRVSVLVEYHDSRGFLEYVAQEINALKGAHRDPKAQGQLDRLGALLAKAQWIVGDLLPAPTPRASVGTYRAIAIEAREIVQQ